MCLWEVCWIVVVIVMKYRSAKWQTTPVTVKGVYNTNVDMHAIVSLHISQSVFGD